MDIFPYEALKESPYPPGIYFLLLAGPAPPRGEVVLPAFKIIGGWPNPILDELKRVTPKNSNNSNVLDYIVSFAVPHDTWGVGCEYRGMSRPEFNMAVYPVGGEIHGAAVYGPLTQNQVGSPSLKGWREGIRAFEKGRVHIIEKPETK